MGGPFPVEGVSRARPAAPIVPSAAVPDVASAMILLFAIALGMIMSTTMVLIVLVTSFLGMILPFVLLRGRMNPAVASGPLGPTPLAYRV